MNSVSSIGNTMVGMYTFQNKKTQEPANDNAKSPLTNQRHDEKTDAKSTIAGPTNWFNADENAKSPLINQSFVQEVDPYLNFLNKEITDRSTTREVVSNVNFVA